ncbi:LURP-one-related/scramblase family protein [Lactiplantibacillus songbeiensis]|uniref:LURP-one-related/scramblase family protein n=1 Tax=Lactiplantibacillus songbeiensis TaxID=2559920 RepID=A0ABW4C112_9LACO|nr:LURP-one-related family protein [Lactiplantibacillus songbeiensis]
MRQLYLNQKVWSVREKFAVLDHQDRPVYQAVGSLFKIPKHFDILDLHDHIVATVTKQPFSWLPRFYLKIGDQQVATIQKRFTFFKPRYDLVAAGLTVTGDFWDMNFDVSRKGQLVGRVAKRWFSIGDKYEMTIQDSADELLIVGLVIAIDYVKRVEAAAASSSTSN